MAGSRGGGRSRRGSRSRRGCARWRPRARAIFETGAAAARRRRHRRRRAHPRHRPLSPLIGTNQLPNGGGCTNRRCQRWSQALPPQLRPRLLQRDGPIAGGHRQLRQWQRRCSWGRSDTRASAPRQLAMSAATGGASGGDQRSRYSGAGAAVVEALAEEAATAQGPPTPMVLLAAAAVARPQNR